MYLWLLLLGRFCLVRKGYSTCQEPGDHVWRDIPSSLARMVAAVLDCHMMTEPGAGNILGQRG